MSQLTLDDDFWSGFEERPLGYKLKQVQKLHFSDESDKTLSISLELSPDLVKIHRNTYSIADWAAEVGGFIGAIWLFLNFCMGLLTFGDLEASLASQLYKYRKNQE